MPRKTTATSQQRRARRTGGGRPRLIIAALAVLAVVVAAGWALVPPLPPGKIAPGLRAGQWPVGGLTAEQAAQAISAGEQAAQGPVRLEVAEGGRSFPVPPEELGITPAGERAAQAAMRIGRTGSLPVQWWQRWEASQDRCRLPVPWEMDQSRARTRLERLSEEVDRPARNACAYWDGSRVAVTPEQSGLRLQVEAALGALESWLARGRRGPVALAVAAAPPEIASEDLAGVDGVVASYSTSVAGTRNRRHNVALAAKALDGVTVKPGAVFSYNRVVGPRTTEAGYKTAPVIIRGELVPGIGGGACQVSSTLYNAALLANMRVVRRSHHSHPIGYVPAGRDATVVYEVIDLRLGNPSPHPLVFQTRLAGRRLTVMVLGKRGGPPVRVFSSRSAVSAGPPMMREDPTLAPGVQVMERPAQEGVRARVVRVIGEGEAAREEVVSSDFYRPSRAIVRVGPSAPGEPAPAAPPAVTPPQ